MSKKVDNMTFKEFFDLVKNPEMQLSIIKLLKDNGFTEKQIEEMNMEKALNLLADNTTKSLNEFTKNMAKVINEKKPPSPSKPVDVISMMKEIAVIRDKHNIPKVPLFVPDRLEICIKRVELNKFDFSYKEFFEYLPNHILDIVAPLTMNMMMQVGFPRDAISRIGENCVGIELKNLNFSRMVGMILIELLLQRKIESKQLESFFTLMQKNYGVLTEFSELEHEYTSSVEMKLLTTLEETQKIMQDNPEASEEMKKIVDKYTQSTDGSGGKS